MSEAKPKKTKKKKKSAKAQTAEEADSAGALPLTAEALEETLYWYYTDGDDKSQLLEVLRLEVLSPYLFSKTLLCQKAVDLCCDHNLLPASGLLPQFFDKTVWNDVIALAKIMAAVQAACEIDQLVYEDVLAGGGTMEEANPALLQRLKSHSTSGQLRNLSDSQIENFYEVIAAQGLDFTSRANVQENLASSFLDSLKDKVKFADAIKVRANANFKQDNFKAAIADYNKAISLCPYNAVLYHNRALCFLRNQELWYACIDSFRALFLYPTWEKPYYRCAEAWHLLGDLSRAMEINLHGQMRCSSTSHLRSQFTMFTGGPESSKRSHSLASSTKDIEIPASAETSKPVSGSGSKKKASKESSSSVTSSRDQSQKKQQSSSNTTTTSGTLEHMKKSSKESSTPTVSFSTHGQEKRGRKTYTELEELQCPEVHPRLTCSELRKLCHRVKLDWCSPAAYFSAAGSKWETLEPEWVEPPPPSTDPFAEREPMLAKFDEIWCPVLADAEESKTIIPPTFQYFSDGTIMHSTAY